MDYATKPSQCQSTQLYDIEKVVEYCRNLCGVMFYYKEIISKLPRKELKKIGEAVGVDYRVSKLTGENVFNLRRFFC